MLHKILPVTISEAEMANLPPLSTIVLMVAIIAFGVYLIDPTFFGLRRVEGFEGAIPGATMQTDSNDSQKAGSHDMSGDKQKKQTESNQHSAGGDATTSEGFGDYEDEAGPASFGSAQGPAGCYPRDQLTPSELLPKDQNSVWAQQNPMGTGSLKGKNFLSAGALIGVNTVGQSLRNANLQLRSEPPNPQVPISVFNNSTIEPDVNRRDFEVS